MIEKKIKFGHEFTDGFNKLNEAMKKIASHLSLTPLEKSILTAISERHPFSFSDVKRAYNYFKSFDKTIACLEESAKGNFSIQDIIDSCREFDDFLKSKGEPKQITEEMFLNKELCDAIRKLVTEHPFNLHQAILIMEGSKDYDRDVDIAGKLGDGGYDKNKIAGIISLINR